MELEDGMGFVKRSVLAFMYMIISHNMKMSSLQVTQSREGVKDQIRWDGIGCNAGGKRSMMW